MDFELLIFLLKNYGKGTKDLEVEWHKDEINKERVLYEELKVLGLERAAARFQLYWNLENHIEQEILRNSFMNYYDLKTSISLSWNSKNKLFINADTAGYMLSRRGLKTDKEISAFLAVCEGNIEGYKASSKGKPKLFANLLTRYLICVHKTKDQLLEAGREIITFYFGEEYEAIVENTYNNLFAKLNSFGAPIQYTKFINADSFTFSKGLASIIGGVQVPVEVQEEPKVEERKETSEASPMKAPQEEVKEVAEASIINSIYEPSSDDSRELKEKIAYLEAQVELLRNKLEDTKENTLKEFVRNIAGNSSNYQLSELYMESEGGTGSSADIIAGKLVNLFSAFELEEIYPYSAGKRTGQVFTVSKSDLAKKFMVAKELQSQEETVKVELVYNGWSYKGKVVVMPLVREVI